MRIIALFFVLFYGGVLPVQDVDAAEYFELYSGINVWARSSFRILRRTSIEDCAMACVEKSACSAFVYSHVTMYCYGRRNVDFRTRRHWHQSRRYDFYRKIKGQSRTHLEKAVAVRGRDNLVFVRRRPGSTAFGVITPGNRSPQAQALPTTATTTTKTTSTTELTRTRIATTPTPDTTTTVGRRSRPRTEPTTTTYPIARRTTTTRMPRTTSETTPPARKIARKPAAKLTKSTVMPALASVTISRKPAIRPTTTTTTTISHTDPISETAGECERAIGLEDGSFPYDQISASSYYWRFTPSNIGINSGSGWMAGNSEVGEYVEIDFGGRKSILAVATQGSSYFFSTEFVSEYKLKFLTQPGGSFETYKEDGEDKIFIGNSDSTTIQKNRLAAPVHAYKIQFHPLKFKENVMMRAEVYEAC